MHRRAMLGVALLAGLAAAAPRRDDDLRGAKLDDLELGPNGIQRKAPKASAPTPNQAKAARKKNRKRKHNG